MTEQNDRLLTKNEIAELVGRIEGSHLITLAERIGLDIVLGVQDAKTARMVTKEIEKMFDDEPAPITCIRTHSVENCFTIPVKDWQAFKERYIE